MCCQVITSYWFDHCWDVYQLRGPLSDICASFILIFTSCLLLVGCLTKQTFKWSVKTWFCLENGQWLTVISGTAVLHVWWTNIFVQRWFWSQKRILRWHILGQSLLMWYYCSVWYLHSLLEVLVRYVVSNFKMAQKIAAEFKGPLKW